MLLILIWSRKVSIRWYPVSPSGLIHSVWGTFQMRQSIHVLNSGIGCVTFGPGHHQGNVLLLICVPLLLRRRCTDCAGGKCINSLETCWRSSIGSCDQPWLLQVSVSFGQSNTPVRTSLIVEDLQQNQWICPGLRIHIFDGFRNSNFPWNRHKKRNATFTTYATRFTAWNPCLMARKWRCLQ